MSTIVSKHSEFRVIGPPGTGKTTWLVRQAERAIHAHCQRTGEQPSECKAVLISSLTRGAANELRSRGVRLHPDQIGTLHAHAYRALDKPQLCVDPKKISKWNEDCQEPRWVLTTQCMSRGTEDDARADAHMRAGGVVRGDELLSDYFIARSRLEPEDNWPSSLREFADAWGAWKRVNGFMDFSDVIHEAYARGTRPPGDPSILFVDEAQDHDRAELRLVRAWAEHCEKVIIVGDPDQNLYEWRGSDPRAFYDHEIPPENTRVLSQSYRVPVAVHRAAMEMIQRCENREPVEYLPRDEPGELDYCDFGLASRQAPKLLEDIERVVNEGKTVMVLSSCEYHLKPLSTCMRETGVPFWNPYDQNRNSFSPLHPKQGVGLLERIKAYTRFLDEFCGEESRVWTGREFALWTEVLKSEGWLKRGARQEIDSLALRYKDDILPLECIEDLLVPDFGIEQLAECGLEWYCNQVQAAKMLLARYCFRIYQRYGAAGLMDDPKVILGTIHSVKGGEADCVFLSPDLSTAGLENLNTNPDSVYRLMYVGMTRAREQLFLMPASRKDLAVEW